MSEPATFLKKEVRYMRFSRHFFLPSIIFCHLSVPLFVSCVPRDACMTSRLRGSPQLLMKRILSSSEKRKRTENKLENVSRQSVCLSRRREKKSRTKPPAPEGCVCPEGSSDMQHTQAEQIEVGTSIHLALEQLESGNLSFNLPSTPRFSESSLNC